MRAVHLFAHQLLVAYSIVSRHKLQTKDLRKRPVLPSQIVAIIGSIRDKHTRVRMGSNFW